MAKTRSQRTKELSANLNIKEISSKKSTNQIKKKTIQREKRTDVQVTADLLNSCRPFSICVDRINGIANVQPSSTAAEKQSNDIEVHKTGQKSTRQKSTRFVNVVRPPIAQTEERPTDKEVSKHGKKTTRPEKIPRLNDLINSEFEKQIQNFAESEQKLQIGNQVLARMKGFQPWPGRVENFSPNAKIVQCYFFGTHNRGPVGSKNIVPFSFAFETTRLVCLRPPTSYIKAVQEIEHECGVPEELSCLNTMRSIK